MAFVTNERFFEEMMKKSKNGARWFSFEMASLGKEGEPKFDEYFKDCYVSPKFHNIVNIITKTETGKKVYIVFKDKQLAGPFKEVSLFNDGFVEVNSTYNGVEFMDMLGRFSSEKTKSGYDFYRYSHNQLSIADLKTEYFADDVFYNGVIEEAKQKFAKQLEVRYGLKLEISPLEFARASIEVEIAEEKRAQALAQKEANPVGIQQLKEKKNNIERRIVAEREEQEKAEQERLQALQKTKEADTNKILNIFDSVMVR